MQTVITINLNGNAYQLDESAFGILRAYLDRAERRLKDNPDRAEILADFEQAIADKCRKYIGPQKSVVVAAEMEHIVAEMGPVDAGDGPDEPEHEQKKEGAMGDQTATGAAAPKRLYRIREGSMIAGVCTGLAAYFDVDVTIVRIIFLALLFITKGVGVLAYFALMFVIPYATTSEERAAAHGTPFNAQELLDQAKRSAETFRKQAEDFAEHGEWRRLLHEQKRQWRAQRRAWKQNIHWGQWGAAWGGWGQGEPGYATQVWAGLLTPLFSLMAFAMFALFAFTLYSLITTSAVFGWPLPADIPLWAGVLILFAVYHLVTSPVRAARDAMSHASGRYVWFAVWDGMFAMGMTCLVFWLVYHYMPPVENLRDFLDKLPDAVRAMGQDVRTWLDGVRAWFQRLGEAL